MSSDLGSANLGSSDLRSPGLGTRAPHRPSRFAPQERHARILRLPDDLVARLSRMAGSTGRVHSVFTRAINVEWAGGRLLTLHGPGPLRAPFAAAVESVALRRAQRPGAVVTVEPGRLRLPGVRLAWGDATRVECAVPIPPPGLDRSVIDVLRALDRRHATDRGPAPDRRHATGLDSPRGVAARAALSAAIGAHDASGLIGAARGLLGLGEGLTPAGDDCLVGALAVLHAVGHPALVHAPAVATAIARVAVERTTAVGREFVVHALAGRFSEPVLALLRARSPLEAADAATCLAGLGATSGADTLAGLRLAGLALA